MDLDSLKIATLEVNLSSLDSLMTTQIASQQSKIDSLSMIVHDTEIAKGYFASVISLQLGVFLFLFGFIGFISWKAAASYLRRKIEESENKTSLKIEGVETRVNNTIQKIEFLEYQLFANASLNSSTAKMYLYACFWMLKTCNSAFCKNKLKEINENIVGAEVYLTYIIKEEIQENILNKIIALIQELSKIDGVEQKSLNNIQNTLNKLFHSDDPTPKEA